MEDIEMTVEQKFAKCMLQLRVVRPFYSALYEVMMKHKSNSIPTMGVDCNSLYYNEEFCSKITFEEFLFVVLHEIGHVGLQHVARRENRLPFLWNIAADLYVNATLANEFGLEPGKQVTVNGINIAMPTSGLYCSSVDLDKDCVEDIYDNLEKQAKKNGMLKLNGNGEKSFVSGHSYEFEFTGSKEDERIFRQDKYWHYKFRVTPEEMSDLISSGEGQDTQKQKSDKIVQDALVRVEMSSQDCGGDSGGLMAQVKKLLKSELDWRKLLRKYLINVTSTDSSFSRPDKRMYYQKSIYPGQMAEIDNSIKGVKVCIDTSGSISDEDIQYFCGQVYDLVKQFKIEAELIYWDTAVESTGIFTGYQEFERVDIVGRGGTDPAVVFNYFDSKKCKVKPAVTLMFTDGFFSTDGISSKQRKKYKDTIWIMTRQHSINFEPPFGKKAIAKFRPQS